MEYRFSSAGPLATVTGLVVPVEKWQTVAGAGDRAAKKGKTREKVAKGAFSRSLGLARNGQRDIKAFAHHQPERILGRTSGQTLRLEETGDGLRFEMDLPDTTDGRDLLELIRRGDIGASMGFQMNRSKVAAGIDAGDGTAWRVMTDVDLWEVSLLPNPAYSGTLVTELSDNRMEHPGLDWLRGVAND